jgi:hydrogenase maturation protease
MQKRVLILCVGNYLMGDEGIGVHLARQLADELNDEQIDVVDGGTGGFQLMDYMESYPSVILVDATLDQREPGTIRLIQPKFSADFPKAMSTHEIGLKDVVESLILLDKLPQMYLFVVSINKVQPLSIELSPEIQAVIPELKKQVRELAKLEVHKLNVAEILKPVGEIRS